MPNEIKNLLLELERNLEETIRHKCTSSNAFFPEQANGDLQQLGEDYVKTLEAKRNQHERIKHSGKSARKDKLKMRIQQVHDLFVERKENLQLRPELKQHAITNSQIVFLEQVLEKTLIFLENGGLELWDNSRIVQRVQTLDSILQVVRVGLTQLEERNYTANMGYYQNLQDSNSDLHGYYAVLNNRYSLETQQKYLLVSKSKVMLVSLNLQKLSLKILKIFYVTVTQAAYFDPIEAAIFQINNEVQVCSIPHFQILSRIQIDVVHLAVDNLHLKIYIAVKNVISEYVMEDSKLKLNDEKQVEYDADETCDLNFLCLETEKKEIWESILNQRSDAVITCLVPFTSCSERSYILIGMSDTSIRCFGTFENARWAELITYNRSMLENCLRVPAQVIPIEVSEDVHLCCCTALDGMVSFIWMERRLLLTEFRMFCPEANNKLFLGNEVFFTQGKSWCKIKYDSLTTSDLKKETDLMF